jgi:hypothetical protein
MVEMLVFLQRRPMPVYTPVIVQSSVLAMQTDIYTSSNTNVSYTHRYARHIFILERISPRNHIAHPSIPSATSPPTYYSQTASSPT